MQTAPAALSRKTSFLQILNRQEPIKHWRNSTGTKRQLPESISAHLTAKTACKWQCRRAFQVTKGRSRIPQAGPYMQSSHAKPSHLPQLAHLLEVAAASACMATSWPCPSAASGTCMGSPPAAQSIPDLLSFASATQAAAGSTLRTSQESSDRNLKLSNVGA